LRRRPAYGLHASIRALKKDSFAEQIRSRRFDREGAMTDVMIDLERPVPSIVPRDIPSLSDDECLARLAQAIADPDSEKLDEVAWLIGRLAVTIE
jgi:hypothetical protein